MSLWTSIRDIGQAAATVVGNIVAPGSGAVTGSLVSSGAQQMLGMSASRTAANVAESIFSGMSGSAQASPITYATAIGAAAAAGYSGLRRIGNIIYSASGRILHVLVGGNKITPAKASVLAKRIGFEAAAAALGIGIVELAQMVFSDAERKRKRGTRGITGADIQRTTRTMRKLNALNKLVGAACPPKRRAAPAARHCHH